MAANPIRPAGYVTGAVRGTLRLEAAAVLLASLFSFHLVHGRWLIFLILFLAPDLSFAAYSISRRWAATAYNASHTYVFPVALMLLSYGKPVLLPYALIWTAHIGMDRALGHGLKYSTGFENTHLGTIGRAQAARPGEHTL